METMAAPAPFNRLTRSRSNRYVGGVAGGLGEHFGVDPVIFRILFVAFTFIGAAGPTLYVIAWLLVPNTGADHSILGRRFTSGKAVRNVAIVIGAALVALVALLTMAVAALGLVAASSDIPFEGGMGDRSWAPSSVQELQRDYRLTAGDLDLDLSRITVPEGVTYVDASVVTGHLGIRVPTDAAVSVEARAGAGDVTVFGDSDEGRNASRSFSPATESARRLVIKADVGLGEVDVVRG